MKNGLVDRRILLFVYFINIILNSYLFYRPKYKLKIIDFLTIIKITYGVLK